MFLGSWRVSPVDEQDYYTKQHIIILLTSHKKCGLLCKTMEWGFFTFSLGYQMPIALFLSTKLILKKRLKTHSQVHNSKV